MAGKSIDDRTIWNVSTTGVNPIGNNSDPFGNRWETHPAAVENQIKDEPPVKYGRTATEILKKEYPTIYNGYMDIVEEQLELFSKKHLDYGMSNISAGTSLATQDEREFALSGLWYRMSDKINRWKNLIISSRGPQNETIIDTFQDICNYAIIAQLVEKDQWRK
jgi:hypothetical protein